MKRPLITTLSAIVLLTVPFSGIASAAQDDSEGTYIIVLKSANDIDGKEKQIAQMGGRTEKRFTHAINGLSVKIKHKDADQLRTEPNVLSVELDQPMFALDTQTPTPSWGLDRTDQRALPLSNSFTASAYGAGVDVYVVDTGVSTTHTDFSGRLRSGFSAINDGRGSNDCNGHGTHVAGTAAGTTYGVAKAASIIPVRVLDCAGSGSNTGVIAGLDWIIANHSAGVAAVANMSLGGGASLALDTAVQNAINDGVVMAVAAGNSNANACNYSPARAANAITVGATDRTDVRASYSNFGSCLDIFAPGTSITSAWINSSTAINTISGTSMASPHVAGVAAALLSANPTLSPADISSMLRSSATPNVVSTAGTELLAVSRPSRWRNCYTTSCSGNCTCNSGDWNCSCSCAQKCIRFVDSAKQWRKRNHELQRLCIPKWWFNGVACSDSVGKQHLCNILRVGNRKHLRV